MIEAVIFDVGGVYMEGSFIDFVNRTRRALGIDGIFHADKEVVFDSDYNAGLISAEECFRKYFGVPISDEQMEDLFGIWTTTWKPTDEMSDLVKRLGINNRLAILSNSDAVNSAKYTDMGWYDPFEVLVLSHEEGINKPDKKIYEIVLDRLGLPAKKCVFIDDQMDALVSAREMGMKTILYENVV